MISGGRSAAALELPRVRGGAGRRATEGSWVSRVASGLLTGLVVVAVLAAIVLAIAPRLLGGAALTVLSGSMEPLYSAGDVVVVVPVAPQDIQVGDVVAFQPVSGDPTLITHRVVSKQLGGGTGEGYLVTRGDANGADDAPIVPEQVMGRVMYSVPVVGHLLLWAGGHSGLLVPVAGVGLVAYAVVLLLLPARRTADAAGRRSESRPVQVHPEGALS